MWGSTAFGGGTITPDPLLLFLQRVVPWSVADPPDSFVNIHALGGINAMPFRGGGRAYGNIQTEIGDVLNFVGYLNRVEANGFICIAAVGHHGEIKGRNRRASRNEEDARLIKSLVLDLDVKPGAYPSQRAALAHLVAFCEKTGLRPGYLINSGYGIHCYFVLTEALVVAAWRVLARKLEAAAVEFGLHFDRKCTVNPVCLFRLPGTTNWKDPKDPRPCSVLRAGHDMTVAAVTAALQDYVPVTPEVRRSNGLVLDPKIFPPRTPLRDAPRIISRDDLDRSRIAANFDDLTRQCEVVAQSAAYGGIGDLEPLWHTFAKLCQHVDDGLTQFHALSFADPRYDPEQTDEKYNKAERLGWPSCATVAASSPDAVPICKRCPHFGKNLSPINFAQSPMVPPTTAVPSVEIRVNGHAHPMVLGEQNPILVPPGYTYDPMSKLIFTPKGKPVFTVAMLGMKLDVDIEALSEVVTFTPRFGLEDGRSDLGTIRVPVAAFASNQTAAVAVGSVWWHDFNPVKSFMTDWTTHIRTLRMQGISSQRQGWVERDGAITGFCCGGMVYGPEGGHPVAGKLDPEYQPRGSLEQWRKDANLYIGKGCIEVEVLIAAAFAAPLMIFTDEKGVTVFAHSNGTGFGKSLGIETGQSVFGSYKAILRDATANYALNRMASLNNLVLMYDEMLTGSGNRATNAKRLGDLILNVSSGVERGRLDRSANPKAVRSSVTMMVAASNTSLTEAATTSDTNALASRVLEIRMSDAIKRLNITEEGTRRRLNQENYGVAGQVYAAFLGKHWGLAKQLVEEAVRYFRQQLNTKTEDRHWLAGVATIYVGARLAKHLGLIDFDILSMKKFLLNLVQEQRKDMQDTTGNADDPETHLARLADFLIKNRRGIILTKSMPGLGRPHAHESPSNLYEVENSNEIVARIATDAKRMLVSVPPLKRFYQQAQQSYREAERALKAAHCHKSAGARYLAGGTTMKNPPPAQYVLEFDLTVPGNERFLTTAQQESSDVRPPLPA